MSSTSNIVSLVLLMVSMRVVCHALLTHMYTALWELYAKPGEGPARNEHPSQVDVFVVIYQTHLIA